MNNKAEILNELKKAMEFYRELGFEYMPVKKSDMGDLLSGVVIHSEAEAADPRTHVDRKTAGRARDKDDALKKLRREIGDCTRCRLSTGRTNIVFGEGTADADLMFIGEGPGRDEDIQARPFVGEAGKLLTNLIVKLGLKRENVYIANIIKCRPPRNRNPEADEITACRSFIEGQIAIVKPKVIVCLGKIAAHAILGIKTPISRLRGNFFAYHNIPVMPTFHPAYLLRNPKDKWLTWEDMQKVLAKLKEAQ